MIAHQAPNLPPALERIATTPVLASERPAGFPHLKITRLAANRHEAEEKGAAIPA